MYIRSSRVTDSLAASWHECQDVAQNVATPGRELSNASSMLCQQRETGAIYCHYLAITALYNPLLLSYVLLRCTGSFEDFEDGLAERYPAAAGALRDRLLCFNKARAAHTAATAMTLPCQCYFAA